MPSKLRMILAPEATDVGAAAEENWPRDVIGDADAGACLLTLYRAEMSTGYTWPSRSNVRF